MGLRIWLSGAVVGATLVLGGSHVAAQNLVANGNFDDVDQVAGWTEIAVWDSADWQDDPSSGSLVNSVPNGIATNSLARYCAAVTPSETIAVSAHVRVDPGQAAGDVRIGWCSGRMVVAHRRR